MAFYIQPPKGNVTISQLENWALKRLQFLVNIFQCHGDLAAVKSLMESPLSVEDSDCLIEGTTKDAVSHFILRLACSGDALCQKVFYESETVLFLHRFTSLSKSELMRYLSSVHQFQKQLTKHLNSLRGQCVLGVNSLPYSSCISNIFQFFKMLTETFDWAALIHQYSLKSEEHYVHLPFEFALELISTRQVILSRGKAAVPCIYLPQLLRWFFQSWLTYGLQLAKDQWTRAVQDSRMEKLFARCKKVIYSHYQHFDAGCGSRIFNDVLASDIDRLAERFPPCMIHLHESLRRNHRLKHYSRIVYILYLKDLGLPVREALSFWKHEYTKPFPRDSSYHGCRHSWEKEERRFTYSIHHLYGLRGSRQKYTSHTCAYIQNHGWGPAEETFCPFKQFDNLKLHQYLTKESVSAAFATEIEELALRKQYSAACSVFLGDKVCKRMETCRSSEMVSCVKKRACEFPINSVKFDLQTQSDVNKCPGEKHYELPYHLMDDSDFKPGARTPVNLLHLRKSEDDFISAETNQDVSSRKQTLASYSPPTKKCRTIEYSCESSDDLAAARQLQGIVIDEEKLCCKTHDPGNVILSCESRSLPFPRTDLVEDSGYGGSSQESTTGILSSIESARQFYKNSDDIRKCRTVASGGVFCCQNCGNSTELKRLCVAHDLLSKAKHAEHTVPIDTVVGSKSGLALTCTNNYTSITMLPHEETRCKTSNVGKTLEALESERDIFQQDCFLVNRGLSNEFKKLIRKPVEYSQSYNDLINELRNVSALHQT